MPDTPLANVRILVVDDDLHSLRLCQAILARAGAAARVVASAEDALEHLKYFKAEIVVTDFRLPGMNGLELARTIKGENPSRLPAIILVSSEAEASLSRAAHAVGCTGVLHKPIDALTFAESVARYFRGSIDSDQTE